MKIANLKKIIRESKSQILKESGFSRVRQIMLGQVPSIDSLAILTAENPHGDRATSKENDLFMRDLKSILRDNELGYTNITGKFGSRERSVMVMNISRDDTTTLGGIFQQAAVIWGQKLRDASGNPFFRFEYIEGTQTINWRDLSLSGAEVQDKKDHYSEKSGRKFVIPFFDDAYERAELSGGRVSFDMSEVPDEPKARELVESIILRNEVLKNPVGKSFKHLWHHRNIMFEHIKQLDKLINDKS